MTVGNHTLPQALLDNCSGLLYCYGKWAYEVTDGLFFVGALLAFATIVFISSMAFGINRAFGYASFVGMVGSMFLVTLGYMPFWTASIFIICGVLGIAMMVMTERE